MRTRLEGARPAQTGPGGRETGPDGRGAKIRAIMREAVGAACARSAGREKPMPGGVPRPGGREGVPPTPFFPALRGSLAASRRCGAPGLGARAVRRCAALWRSRCAARGARRSALGARGACCLLAVCGSRLAVLCSLCSMCSALVSAADLERRAGLDASRLGCWSVASGLVAASADDAQVLGGVGAAETVRGDVVDFCAVGLLSLLPVEWGCADGAVGEAGGLGVGPGAVAQLAP